jgi:hypothetical protein
MKVSISLKLSVNHFICCIMKCNKIILLNLTWQLFYSKPATHEYSSISQTPAFHLPGGFNATHEEELGCFDIEKARKNCSPN